MEPLRGDLSFHMDILPQPGLLSDQADGQLCRERVRRWRQGAHSTFWRSSIRMAGISLTHARRGTRRILRNRPHKPMARTLAMPTKPLSIAFARLLAFLTELMGMLSADTDCALRQVGRNASISLTSCSALFVHHFWRQGWHGTPRCNCRPGLYFGTQLPAGASPIWSSIAYRTQSDWTREYRCP